MTRSLRLREATLLATLSFAALIAAGCGTANDPSQANQAAEGNSGAQAISAHVMPIQDGIVNRSAPSGAHLNYQGGPVISNVKVVQVLYGSGTYAPDITGPELGNFYQALTGSAVFDWLAEYNTDTLGGNQQIGHGAYAAQAAITPSPGNTKTDLNDGQIQSELGAQIASGALPPPDANTIYMVHFPKGVQISLGWWIFASHSCQPGGFCAYHGSFTHSGQRVAYAVLPDMSPGSGCEAPHCGSDPVPFNNATTVASHELIEAVTDVAVGERNIAWYDNSNGEIGDICVGQQGTFVGADGVTYTAQLEFSNKANNCILVPDAGS